MTLPFAEPESGAEFYLPVRGHRASLVILDEIGYHDRFVSHVGIGGTTRIVETHMDLGRGVWRTPEHGLRRAIWDAAFGYVSGFRKRDIAYYVITRSLSERLSDRVIEWERRRNDR